MKDCVLSAQSPSNHTCSLAPPWLTLPHETTPAQELWAQDRECAAVVSGQAAHITKCQASMSSGTSCGRNITFGNITEANVNQLRKMNASIFPVRYHDKFYADVPNGNPDFNQFGESSRRQCVFERVPRPFVVSLSVCRWPPTPPTVQSPLLL